MHAYQRPARNLTGPTLMGIGLSLATGAATSSWMVGILAGTVGFLAYRVAMDRSQKQ